LEHLGLAAALKSLLHEFTLKYRIGGQIRFRDIPAPPDKEISLTFFRVAQEALRNVGKHSEATNIRMELVGESVGWLMRISDDGVGFDASTKILGGLGMISMKERLRLVNGELSIWSRPGLGTQVEARVPCESKPTCRNEMS
jgi:signal transduction histidine kinase